MSDNATPATVSDNDIERDEYERDDAELDEAELEDAELDDVERDDVRDRGRPERVRTPTGERRYRPGRGGFDPEAAEIAARAKYAFRQRVVLGLIVAALLSAVLAASMLTPLWWAHGAIDLGLVGYLGYLRRQVRIENEIRLRRAARLSGSRHVHDDAEYDDELPEAEPDFTPVRRPMRPRTPVARMHNPKAVVVDLEDEDPAFEELGEPGQLPYRRAVGE